MWLSSGEGGAPPSPPPLGKHDRQEKRHKIASYLSQNSGGGGDDAMMADMHEERSQQLVNANVRAEEHSGRTSRTQIEGEILKQMPRAGDTENGY